VSVRARAYVYMCVYIYAYMYIVAVAGHEEGAVPVSSSGVGAGDPVIPPTYPEAVRQLLRQRLPAAELEQVIWERDLCSLTKVSLRGLAALCKGKDEADALLKLASSQRRFSAHVQTPAIDIVELLVALPSCRPALSDLMAVLPALTPRLYSISSSPLQYDSDRTPAEEEGAAPSTSCLPASCTLTFVFVLVNRTLPRNGGAGCDIRVAAKDNGEEVEAETNLSTLFHNLTLARRTARSTPGAVIDAHPSADTHGEGVPDSAMHTRTEGETKAVAGGEPEVGEPEAIYRAGLCTGFLRALCHLIPGAGRRDGRRVDSGSEPLPWRGAGLKVALKRADKFQMPVDPRTPMVLVAFGTGLAPFLGFLWHRRLSPPAQVVCVCV
jgi:hypothetical protein